MVNTGIYVRVSTEEQAKEGYSIRAQDAKLRDYARIKDWNVYNVYIDEGISGKNIDARPAMRQLIADITSHKVNNVLVYKVDRLTRSTKNLIELIELFNEHHCAFNSLMESIDTETATGRMFLKIVGIFAEFERENLVERVKLGFERKAREGYSLCSATPSYGYTREIGDKIIQAHQEEAEVVKRIFDMYLNYDYSCIKISKLLNAQNIPTKKNKKWNAKTIRLILSNPNYIGKVRYSVNDLTNYFEADGKHDKIIDDDMYYQVQEKLGKIKKISHTKRPTEDVYFCGLLYCSKCGTKYSSKWNYNRRQDGKKAAYPSYRCINGIKGVCDKGTISHLKMEKAFEDYISNIQDFTEIDTLDGHGKANHDFDAEKESLVKNIELLEKKIAEVMELFVSNTIDFKTYQDMIKLSAQRRSELEIKLANIVALEEKEEVVFSKKDIISNFNENWQMLDNKERQQFIQKFIKKIIINIQYDEKTHASSVKILSVEFHEF